MTRRRIAVITLFLFFSLIFSISDAFSATVFGPQELTIGRWRSHLARHTFELEQEGGGVIEISKITPQHDIRGGFLFFNKKLISLRDFLIGEELTFQKEVSLKSTNRLFIFIRGTTGASISLAIRHKDSLAPEILSFTATPPVIKIGDSSMLTWQTKNAETCEISPGLGSVDPQGSVTVEPMMSTTYTLSINSYGQTVTAAVTIEIENSTPVAAPQEITTIEDTAASIVLSGSDSDNDALSFEIYSQPLYGVLTGDAPNLIYTPSENFNQSDSFEFIVHDGTVDSEPALVAITVTPVNDAPIAEPQSVNLNEDEILSVELGAADVDGDTLTYQITSPPAHGILDGIPPDVTYTPAANYSGSDALEFRVNDGMDDSPSAIVTFIISPINDVPVATNDTAVAAEDNPADINVLVNDSDADEDILSISDITQPHKGIVVNNSNGVLTYIPNSNVYGSDSFSYTVSDGNGGFDTAMVTVSLIPINDAPEANDDSANVDEDSSVLINLLANDEDVDGDILSISEFTEPFYGVLQDHGNGSVTFFPEVDYHGSDSFTYTVTDGGGASDSAEVTIFIESKNDAPIANADSDQSVSRLDTVVLSGSGSDDVDGDSLNYQWSFSSVPVGSTTVLSNSSTFNPNFVPDLVGTYAVQLIVNDGTLDSSPDTVMITADPRQVIVPDVVGQIQANAETALLGVNLVAGTIATAYSDTIPADHVISQAPAAGATIVEGSAVNLVVSLGPENKTPVVSISASTAEIHQGESTTLSWSSTHADSAHIDNGIGIVNPNDSSIVSPEHTTTYTIAVAGPDGNASATVTIKVQSNPAPQPEGSFGENYENLVPPDATVDQYDPKRFALISGKVQNLTGAAISDVTIAILSHPQYGTVTTDAQGQYSIPVEGGGAVAVVYRKEGFIAAQRKVYVPWNDIATTDTVVMIAEDPASTTLTFDGNPDTVITHESTDVMDESGTRSLTMVFSADNQAYLVDENGNDVQHLTTITTRATEYTTPESMPAKLPPTSAFTYCAELTVDGAERVRFEKPVFIWVDNFLNFPVGVTVPVGYYNRDRGVWVPMENGVVVQLLDTEPAGSPDGKVDALDADGDGLPNDLDGDGTITNDVQGLDDSQRYVPGTTFWRAAVTHFSSVDLNLSFGAGPGAIPPNPGGEAIADHKASGGQALGEQLPNNTRCISSFVEQRSRIFHEDINIAGTDMTLHYTSSRAAGFKPGVFSIPASGDTVPESLISIIVEVQIAGKKLKAVLPAAPNQSAEIEWDGLDYLGKPVSGPLIAYVRIGFVYYGLYYVPSPIGRAFGQPGIRALTIPTREEVTLWKNIEIPVIRGQGNIAEGWNLSSHHYVSPIDPAIIFKGDGTVNRNNAVIIDTYAGNGSNGFSGMGGPATEAKIRIYQGLETDSAGNLYFNNLESVSYQNWRARVLKVATDGIITEVFLLSGQNTGIALDAQNNIYVSQSLPSTLTAKSEIVRKVDMNGVQSTFAGIYNKAGFVGDGGPATEAHLYHPMGLAFDDEGNLYIADTFNNRIRKVDTSGIITTVAGSGPVYPSYGGYSGDGGPAIYAQLKQPHDVAVDSAGNIYIADTYNGRVRKVDTSGIITTIAGNGVWAASGDGGPAVEAGLNPRALDLDAAGNLYIVSDYNHRVRKVDTKGIITTIAGSGPVGHWSYGAFAGDGGPATGARLNKPDDIALDAAGNIFVADSGNGRIRKISPPAPRLAGLISGSDIAFIEENGVAHIMTGAGRHKQTIDLDTGLTLYEFGYDGQNNLTSITDQFGNLITVERDGNGIPTAIVSPDQIRTDLTIDANNNLIEVIYADGSYYDFEYTADGLMTAEIEPQGNRFDHIFDDKGRLTDVTDEEGGHWSYTRTVDENGNVQVDMTTAENNAITYLDTTASTGAYTSDITDSTGAHTAFSKSDDGLTVNQWLPCGMDLIFHYDVDSEYKIKVLSDMTESTPSGLDKVTQLNKTYQDTDSNDIPDLITDTVTVNNKTTALAHNTLQTQKVVTSPEGRTVTLLYNPENLLAEKVSVPGLFDTSYGYDAQGRLTSISTNTRLSTYGYNAQGFLETVTDSGNQSTTYSYDPLGRVSGIIRPDGSFIEFEYDANGNMTVLTKSETISHGFGYNRVNRNDSYQTPLSGSYSYIYDKDRRLIQTNFPSGKYIINDYVDPTDPSNKSRLQQTRTPEGNIGFTYLCGTKIESITKSTDSIMYGYDGKLVTSETLGGTLNQSLTYTYNHDFDVSGFTYAGGTVNYSYDNDGLITGVGSYTVDRNAENGLPESVTGGALNLARTFNGYGEMESQSLTVNSLNVGSWLLIRDNNGRITDKTETVAGADSNYVYTYDAVGRLLTVTKDSILVEEYQYDLNGTRSYEMNSLRGIAGRTFNYSDEDHLLTAGSVTYSYDLDGFLTSKTDGSEVTTYSYSSRGELLTATLPDNTAIEYMHDPLGRRIAKKINGAIVEKYLWRGLTQLLAVYDGSGNLLMRFEYADDRVPLAMTKEGVTYYLSYDQVGSLRLVADGAGNVVKRIDYDSFGNIIADSNATFTIPFGFAGGMHDRHSGLVRFGYRDYDPDVGRWTAKDPIGFAGGDTDLYGYVLNNPINFFDPFGLQQKGSGIWSGAGGNIGGILLSGGVFTGIYRVTSWDTGQSCWIMTTCSGGGAGLGGSLSLESAWIWDAYSSKDLSGQTSGGLAFGGAGLAGVGGSYGAGGCDDSPVGPLENPSSSSATTYGVGGGLGAGYLAGKCKTTVLSCN